MSSLSYSVGQKIELNDGRIATVRFVGTTSFQTGEWIGVELEEATGKNDGSVQGERYFECAQGYGMFLKPAGVKQVVEPTKPKARQGGVGGAPNGRLSSAAPGINGLKRQSLQVGGGKRDSLVGASPTPAARPSGLRSPAKSPSRQLGSNGVSSASTSRTSTPPGTARQAATSGVAGKSTARMSLAPSAGRRTSTMPSASSTTNTRTGRPSIAPPSTAAKTAASNTVPGRLPPSVGRGALGARQSLAPGHGSANRSQLTSKASQSGVLLPKSSTASEAAQETEEETKPSFAPPPIPPDPPDRTSRTRRPSSPGATSTHSGRTIRSNTASTKQIEELEAKVRVLERKRLEDREIKATLERTQQERDKYQNIIEKLQTKYQPQSREVETLRKQLAGSEDRLAKLESTQAEHDSMMEMAALDREMAEETSEALQEELKAVKARNEDLLLELELLREENEEFSKEMSPDERTSAGWLQMEKSNQRLREALLRLRDMTEDREAELKTEIRVLEDQVKELDVFKGQFDQNKEKLLSNEADVEDLRQQLEAALGAEEMIEELTERNMMLQQKMEELRGTIVDLEDLKELNDELEINHVEAEKQMQEELDFKESLLLDRERTAKQQQEAIDDADYTIRRFRELVSTLQSDLQDMQASKQLSETESADLQNKSRAMIDLNMKLQTSAAKTQVKTIDLELRKLEAQEASEHLAIVQLFLPEAFHTERDSIFALLRFKRIRFKAKLVHGFVKERIASYGSRVQDESVFSAYRVLDELTWIAAMSDRFVNAICSCTVDQFANFESALYELEPVERALNSYVDGLRRNELKEKNMAEELQRSIAVMTHLASLHVQNNLASHADDLLMRVTCLQSQLENTASSLGLIKRMTETTIHVQEDDDDDDDEDGSVSDRALLLNRAEALMNHARNAKVMVQKAQRSLTDLLERSLTLEGACTAVFDDAELITSSVADYVRLAGETLQSLFGEEGRSEIFVPAEIESALSRTAMSVFQLSAPDAGPFHALAGQLRNLTVKLVDLAALPTDLDNTVEFERASAPWVARATELKQTKIASIDTEAELERARETVKGRDAVLREKETELEEQSLRIEMLEARMKDAGKRSGRIAELERELHKAQEHEKKARVDLAHAKREAQQDSDRLRAEMGSLALQHANQGTGPAPNADAMGAGAIMMMKKRMHTISSLQCALRHLSEENRRLRLPPPDSALSQQSRLGWMTTPLAQTRSEREREQQHHALHSEGKDVLLDLLSLATKSPAVDLSKIPQNKLAWRSAKDSSRWRVESRKEEWEKWNGWREDVVRRAGGHRRVKHETYSTVSSTNPRGKPDLGGSQYVKVVDPEATDMSSVTSSP